MAWLVNVRGARNVWAAEPPEYRGRAITQFTEDDGLEIGVLRWLPGWDRRGCSCAAEIWSIPAASFPIRSAGAKGVEQGVWLATLEGTVRETRGRRQPVGSESDPAMRCSRKRNQIWTVGTHAGDKPVLIAQPARRCRGPDAIARRQRFRVHQFAAGPQLHRRVPFRRQDAALSGRQRGYRHLACMVAGFEIGGVRPDPRAIADAQSAGRCAPRRTPGPFASPMRRPARAARSGRHQPGPGSAFHPTGRRIRCSGARGTAGVSVGTRRMDAPLFGVDGRRRGGAAHARRFRGGTRRVDARMAGRWSTRRTRTISTAAMCGGSASQAAAGRAAVTSGAGIEWSPVALDGGTVAFLRSDAHLPARAAVQIGTGAARDLAPDSDAAPTFPAASLVDPQPVIFPAADGHADPLPAFLPREAARKRPAVIFFHGGSRRQMLLGWHYMYYYNNAYALNQFLAALGYVVLSVNYRSGIGYGLNFREAAQLRPGGRQRVQRCHRRGALPAQPHRRGPGADRAVGRILWRVSDGAGPGARRRTFSRRGWISTAFTIGRSCGCSNRGRRKRGRLSNRRRWRR